MSTDMELYSGIVTVKEVSRGMLTDTELVGCLSLVHTSFWKTLTGRSYLCAFVLFVAMKKRISSKICFLPCFV